MQKLEEVSASTSTPLLGDLDPLQALMTIDDVADSLTHTSSPSTSQTELSSASYGLSTATEPAGLTLDEAAELLKALDVPDLPQTLVQDSSLYRVAVAQFSPLKEQKQRRKSSRKKTSGPSTGKVRNPSRERLQNELAYLRKKVVQLEEELRVLQLGRRPTLSLTGSRDRGQDGGGAGARVWQRIAQRQAQGRDEAEAENRKLKGVLAGQIQLAQRLEGELHKLPNVSVFREEAGGDRNKRLYLGTEDLSSMYELFLSELDGLYAQMDGLFQKNGLETSVDDSLRKAYVRMRQGSEDQDELYAELHDVNVIPFEFEQTSLAMWYAVKRQFSKNRYHSYEGVKDRPDDTIAAKIRSKCQRRGVDGWLDTIMAMRCYAEHDRLVIVWRSVSRGEDQLSGMYTDETGWSVLKRIPPDSGLRLTGSIMHNCVHIVPKRVDFSSATPQTEIGLLTNLVIDSYQDDVIALSAMVEDLLLQDSVASPVLPRRSTQL